MLLLRIDPTDRTVNILSIPRDTQAQVPGIGVTKINHANAVGGPALTRQVVSEALNGITIDRYVRVSTEALRALVDQLGGIEVNVPERMEYEDKTQKLKIDLQPGLQTLNGDQAEQFARFRHDNYGDVGRVQRQQTLLTALRNRLSNPLILPRIPRLVRVMQQYIDTNLGSEEILALVNFGLKLDRDNLRMVMLPGRFSAPNEFSASYWVMDPQGRDRVMQEYFKLGNADVAVEPSASQLRISLQNAAGRPEAAKEFARHLATLGYENIVILPDVTDQQRQTQVIVQRGDLQAAKLLQQSLGFGKVEAASVGDLESDLTIRVGEDWLKAQQSQMKY